MPAPAAPSGLSATARSLRQVDLAWTDNATNESGFRIERKLGAGGAYAEIARVGADASRYSDTSLAAGTLYFYRVRATQWPAATDSAYLVEATATTWTAQQWRTNYFSAAELANPAISGDAADPDGDGVCNLQEMLCGTSPRDATDYLGASSLTRTLDGSQAILVWHTAAGIMCQAQYSTNLVNWMTADAAFTPDSSSSSWADDGSSTGTVPSAAARRFYRVVTVSGP